ncbi:MAG: metallophosphoesterase [Marmoricola sp.]
MVLERRRVLRVGGFLLAFLAVAVPSWLFLFTHSSEEMVFASHDAIVQPNLDGRVRLDMGPYLPDLRTSTGGRIGVAVEMGKTTATTTPELAERYAAIAARPEAEVRRVEQAVISLAVNAALGAVALGLVPIALWLLVGPRRRAQLWRRRWQPLDWRVAIAVTAVAAIVVMLVPKPWDPEVDRVQPDTWIPVQDAVTDVTVPQGLNGWEIQGGLVTRGTRRLLSSLFDTYDRSKVFYAGVIDRVDDIADQLRRPEEGETVAVLVSDRHDNIGMDEVVRAVADEAGATVVLDAGDDTSTGETWEEFSLDSLDSAFEGYDFRAAISGNHDNGTFVNRHLESLGWTHFDGKSVMAFDGVRMTGVDDPRSSGLGTWRDEKGLSFDEVKASIADDVCDLDEQGDRIATLLVHDANLGATALARGCTDLVLAGHVHAQIGPTRRVGTNAKAGYTYTNGTTGGAAYAIAIGSKLRRDAQFSFITYREGRPVGIQPVTVRTTGELVAADYIPLDLG